MEIVKVPVSATNPIGFFAILPDGYDASKKWPVIIFLHGVGGRGDGSVTNANGLKLLLEGIPASNYPPECPADLQKGAAATGFILMAPQIWGDWNNTEVNHCINYALTNLSADAERIHLTGFSLGGGGVTRYISSSAANAERIATATSCGGLNWGGTYVNVKNTALPVLFVHCANDNTVTVGAHLNPAFDTLNALNPVIKPLKMVYKSGGHSQGLIYKHDQLPATPAIADFFNTPAVTWYEWLKLNTKNVGFIYPSGSATIPPPSGQLTVAKAGGNKTTNSTTFELDGTASVNYKQAAWKVVSGPGNWWNISGNNGWWGVKQPLKNLEPGVYNFVLSVSADGNNWVSDAMQLTVTKDGTPPVKPVFVSSDVPAGAKKVIVYEDKSIEFS